MPRVDGVFPLSGFRDVARNFSAAYTLAFCAGVYFSGRMGWWLPLCTGGDGFALNLYYLHLGWNVSICRLKYQCFNMRLTRS